MQAFYHKNFKKIFHHPFFHIIHWILLSKISEIANLYIYLRTEIKIYTYTT